MSKKGAFIYQQIELTTAEWADNVTVYPTSVWLFERLENGKFNMKLADGVHTFAQLPAVMQEVKVTVKTNDATTYILTITTAEVSLIPRTFGETMLRFLRSIRKPSIGK